MAVADYATPPGKVGLFLSSCALFIANALVDDSTTVSDAIATRNIVFFIVIVIHKEMYKHDENNVEHILITIIN